MAASSPGDPRALSCRYCGGQRRFLRRALVCATCDDTARWPGGALDEGRDPGLGPSRGPARGTGPAPGTGEGGRAAQPGAGREEDGREPG